MGRIAFDIAAAAPNDRPDDAVVRDIATILSGVSGPGPRCQIVQHDVQSAHWRAQGGDRALLAASFDLGHGNPLKESLKNLPSLA